MSKHIYILGSGFSKAIIPEFPLLNDLTELIEQRLGASRSYVIKAFQHNGLLDADKKFTGVINNFEELLVFLYQNFPWKSEEDYHLYRAGYLHILKFLEEEFSILSEQYSEKACPQHLKQFILQLNAGLYPVFSFNYDTLLEDFALKALSDNPNCLKLRVGDFYQVPLSPVESRKDAIPPKSQMDHMFTRTSFKLFKLHGSINWYIYNNNGQFGDHLYLVGNTSSDDLKKDLSPLIIPPLIDKASLFKQNGLNIQWRDFASKVALADHITIIGYSLPQTDLAVKLLLSSSLVGENGVIRKKKITVINKDTPSREEYFIKLFKGHDLTYDNSGFNEETVKKYFT